MLKPLAKLLLSVTSMAVSFGLTYLVLRRLDATDVMWLLYWLQMPLTFASFMFLLSE